MSKNTKVTKTPEEWITFWKERLTVATFFHEQAKREEERARKQIEHSNELMRNATRELQELGESNDTITAITTDTITLSRSVQNYAEGMRNSLHYEYIKEHGKKLEDGKTYMI